MQAFYAHSRIGEVGRAAAAVAADKATNPPAPNPPASGAMDLMEGERATEVNSPCDKSVPSKPKFPPLKAHEISDGQVQYRAISIPPHRMTPLRKAWEHDIFPLITNEMKIDVCVNRKNLRRVEMRTTNKTPDIENLHECAAFIEAFMFGFDVKDAEALLRVDGMQMDSFEVKDVKATLKGEHLSRALGRVSGKGGKTKFAIENATRTRIVIAGKKIHILGSYTNVAVAKTALSSLILGSPPAKVYSKLRAVTARAPERF